MVSQRPSGLVFCSPGGLRGLHWTLTPHLGAQSVLNTWVTSGWRHTEQPDSQDISGVPRCPDQTVFLEAQGPRFLFGFGNE